MRLGITIPYADHLPRELVVGFVQEADRAGYDSVWVAEAYGWDGFTVLTQLAVATQRIKIATGIVNVFSRSPALIAQTAASLDLISNGRFLLGLGTSGHQVIEGWHGVKFERGIQRLRETMEIVRIILRRERLVYEGEIFHLDLGAKLITHPVRERIPIYLATLTPSGISLTGEAADGWLPVHVSPAHFESVVKPPLEEGARKAGRGLEQVSICAFGVPVVVTKDRAAGREAVRPHLALYLGGMGSRQKNYYNQLFRRYGWEEEAARIQDLYLERRRDEAMAVLSDEMIDAVTVIGTLEECREQLAEYERVGADEAAIALQVPGNDPGEVMAALHGLAPR